MTSDKTPEPILTNEQIEEITEGIKKIADACKKIIEAIAEIITKAIKGIASWISKIRDCIMFNYCNNPKWWHYYKHAKKSRTRKKYFNMIRKAFIKEIYKEVTPCKN